MLLSRTRRNLTHKAKEWAFKFGNMQPMLDENEKRLLEQSMGFPGLNRPGIAGGSNS